MRSSRADDQFHSTLAYGGLLALICGVLFLDGLDISMVATALPRIGRELHMAPSSLQWVVSAYVLGYGGLLLLGGRAADLLGRRRVLLGGLAVFAVASFIGGLANDGSALIATRFIKGAAAAFTAPAGLSIITTTFAEGPVRNKALSIYTAVGASGWSLGLVFGGLLTELGWRYTFFLPVPISLAILLIAPRFLEKDPPIGPGVRQGFDFAGTGTLAAAMLGLVYTVVEAPNIGWGAPRTLLSFVGVALLLSVFVLIEQHKEQPLVRLGILRSPALRRANFGAMALVGSWFGFQFIGTLYMQNLRGWSPVEMALAFLPTGVIVAYGATRMGAIVNRVGTALPIVTGLTCFAISYLLFLNIGGDSGYLSAMLPTFLLAGLGFTLAFGPLNVAATTGVADQEQGLASGLVQTSFQVGGAIGLAVSTAVIEAGTSGSSATLGSAKALLDGFHPGLVVSLAIAVIGIAVTLSPLLSRFTSAKRRGKREAPAMDSVSARRVPTNRPTRTPLPLWRSKSRSTCSTRSERTPDGAPWASRNGRANGRPSRKPTTSPPTAATQTSPTSSGSATSLRLATTPRTTIDAEPRASSPRNTPA
jgi:MFS family permease